MTGLPSSWWLGDDVVVLRGESAWRAYAAMALELRRMRADARRNGTEVPDAFVDDLRVLRLAAERVRPSSVTGRRGSSSVGAAGGVPLSVSQPVEEVPQVLAASALSHEDLVDVVEIARRLGVSEPYARRLCRHGRFESARRAGREWRVSVTDLEAFAVSRMSERSA